MNNHNIGFIGVTLLVSTHNIMYSWRNKNNNNQLWVQKNVKNFIEVYVTFAY